MYDAEDTTMSTIANDVALPRTGGSRRWSWWMAGTVGALLLVGVIEFTRMSPAMA